VRSGEGEELAEEGPVLVSAGKELLVALRVAGEVRRCDEEADGRVSPPREEGEVAGAVRRAGEGGAKVVPSRREQLEGGGAPGDGAPVDRGARPLPPRGGVPSLQQPLPPKLVVAVALGEGEDVGRPLAAADAVAAHRSDQPLAPPLPPEVEGVVRLDGSSSLRR